MHERTLTNKRTLKNDNILSNNLGIWQPTKEHLGRW